MKQEERVLREEREGLRVAEASDRTERASTREGRKKRVHTTQ